MNGLTPQHHSLAVANLDYLFESAQFGWSHPDKKGDVNLKSIHRFFSPMDVDGSIHLVKITVKELPKSEGNRIYTVESVEFDEVTPAAEWVASSAKSDGIDLTSIRSAGDLLSLAKSIDKSSGVLNQSSARGGFDAKNLQVILNKGSDISTFQHEM